jgi:hypothetical protein
MSTVIVIARNPGFRDRWCTALRARGVTPVAMSSLMNVPRSLDDDEVGAIVLEVITSDDLSILGPLSNLRSLPPLVVVTAGRDLAPVPSRIRSAHILDAALDVALAADRVVALAATRSRVAPTHLPFRLTFHADAQWTERLSATLAADAYDSFDGATHPDGFGSLGDL